MRLRWKLAQFFEIIWWRSYLKKKEKNDYLHKKQLYWKDILAKCAPVFTVQPGDSVIDMGCGPSGLYIVLNEQKVTAVDPLLDKYEQDLEVFNRAAYPNATFVVSPIESYEDTRQYQYVFCMNAINHVSDIEAGFKKLVSLAQPGGYIIVTIDAHNRGWLKSIFRIGPGDVLHPHQYDDAEYTNMLEAPGCKVLSSVLLGEAYIFNHYMLIARKN